MDCISETEVGNSDHLPLLCEILNIVLLISERAGGRCEMYSLKLFTTVLRISVSKHAQALTHRVSKQCQLKSIRVHLSHRCRAMTVLVHGL